MKNDVLSAITDFVIPRTCFLCGETSPAQGNSALCLGCDEDLPRLLNGCRQCGLPLSDGTLPGDQRLCGQCLQREPRYDRCFAPFLYQAPISNLILQFKNQSGMSQGRILCSLFLNSLSQANFPEKPDIIIPTPLHWRRQLFRGFNQAAFIAAKIALELQLPLVHAIKRSKFTPKQQNLNRKERIRNYRQVFTCDKKIVWGKTVALIDDVVTTGATAEAMSDSLKKAGAKRVLVWAIARTPATHNR